MMSVMRCPMNGFTVLVLCLAAWAAAWSCSRKSTEASPTRVGDKTAEVPVPVDDTAPSPIEVPVEEQVPDAASMPLPDGALEYRLDLDTSIEHGCSQSMESDSIKGTMVLRIFGKNKAVLSLELERFHPIGPSLGKFKQGETEFIHTVTKTRSLWTGKADRGPLKALVKFDRVEASSVSFQGYGDVELPPAKSSASSLQLDCSIRTIEVYPPARPDAAPEDMENENPFKQDALLCTSSQELLDRFYNEILVDEAIPLGADHGLTVIYRKFYFQEDKVIRENPDPKKKPKAK